MDSVWLTTAVQIIFCTPKATSTSLRPSDHLSPSFTTVFLIFAYNAFRSWSASHGLISKLQSDRWFASFLANLAIALALASSSSSSAAGAGFVGAAFLGAAAGAAAFFSALALALA